MTNTQVSQFERWRFTLFGAASVFLVLLLMFWSTAENMVWIWYNRETYNHGFIILPISLWLVWHKRAHLSAYSPMPSPAFLVMTAGALLVWILARLIGVLVVEQLAFVAVVITALVSTLGWQVSRFLAFPLLFLFFAVPMGEDLVPPMMEFTATFTVEALKLTGIPVYRDGLWFSLPSGNWSVVEACSGTRYLMASVTLGVMYAYITYHTLWKRLLFIAMSAIVPIIANGIRAYMIVMIGHLSGMEYATGVDHLLYGWVFFGIVMFILFWIGSFWHEEETPPCAVVPPQHYTAQRVPGRTVLTVIGAIAISAVALAFIDRAEGIEAEVASNLEAPESIGGWQRATEGTLWSAAHQATPYTLQARYRQGDDDVQLFAVLFPRQRQGAEAISGANRIVEEPERSVDLGRREISLGAAGTVAANSSREVIDVDSERQEHLVWQWYRVAGRSLTNRYEGKAWEALARLYPGRADGLWLAVSTRLDSAAPEISEQRLAAFVGAAVPDLYRQVDIALGVAD